MQNFKQVQKHQPVVNEKKKVRPTRADAFWCSL